MYVYTHYMYEINVCIGDKRVVTTIAERWDTTNKPLLLSDSVCAY